MYTWNDLGYSLSPNNAGGSGTQVRSEVPGVWKAGWQALFFGLGVAGPVLYENNEVGQCGGYVDWICQAVAEQATLGYPSASTLEHVQQVSVGYYADRIRIPVLLSQGQHDSLFNLNEAVATYDQLRAQGNEVRMLWQSWGHTAGTPVAGELDTGTLEAGSADLRDSYQGRVYTDWMAHWLKDEPNDLGPAVRYFRDYAYEAAGRGRRRARRGHRGVRQRRRLPGRARRCRCRCPAAATLVRPGEPVEAGSAVFTATGGAPGTSTGEAVTGAAPPQQDAPGTAADWTTAALRRRSTSPASPS